MTKFIAFYQGVDDRQDAYPKVLLKGEEYQLGILDSDLTGGCMFQTNLGICGIHTFTPMVCQTYPWVLDSNDDLVGADNILCNHQFPTGSPEETRAAIKKFWEENQDAKKVIAEWNEQYGNDSNYGAKDFLEFINCWRNETNQEIIFKVF